MISSSTNVREQGGRPVLWGLSARDLHDAFWHARGVQCVRRGEGATLQSAAEIYLLIEPGQLVLFNIAEFSERLTWHDALVTRLRLVDERAEPYSERVVLDDAGLVERIERRYRPAGRETWRVVLTTRKRIAALWARSPGRREGWTAVRNAVPWSRVDHGRLHGAMFLEGAGGQERDLIGQLVERWNQPDQSIDGLEQTGESVWHLAAQPPPPGPVRVGPLWLGTAAWSDDRPCRVGPDWIADDRRPGGQAPAAPARVRPIADVTLPERGAASGAAPHSQLYPAVKRAMDLACSAAGLVMLSPLLALIALLILLEDGRPVFFGHRRQGRGGRPFNCWKFRTMHRDAERIARDLEAYNLCDGPQVYIQDDPRVTRIGRTLRDLHLDELPQLWNVLRGQMSLVGPRPSPDDENQYCPAWRDGRLSVRPGITGLWQLKRTREPGEDFQEWIKYDLQYVEQASLWFDLTILAKTAGMILLGRADRAPE